MIDSTKNKDVFSLSSNKKKLNVNSSMFLPLLPPFPIVLVTTKDNIITIGQIQHFTFKPPRIGIAVAHSRFSYSLIKNEKEFVINIPDKNLIEAVKICGSQTGKKVDKFKLANLTPEASESLKSARILQCKAHIECQLEDEIKFEKRSWFIGQVKSVIKEPDFSGDKALMCNRFNYSLPGDPVSSR